MVIESGGDHSPLGARAPFVEGSHCSVPAHYLDEEILALVPRSPEVSREAILKIYEISQFKNI